MNKILEKIKHFSSYTVLFITILFIFTSCKTHYNLSKINGKKININESLTEDKDINAFIEPFAKKINSDMDKVLAYNPETLDKSIKLSYGQTKIGNWFTDITLEKTNQYLVSNQKKLKVDICLLNSGGIRAPLQKGDVTTRHAFEIMPFENAVVILELKGSQIYALINQFIVDKKPHPLSGLKIYLNKDYSLNKIMVNDIDLNLEQSYYLATTDYNANGGDGMEILTQAQSRFDTNYKLRNLLIDYFIEVDSIKVNDDIRIILNN